MGLGYDGKLYILAFDHRGSFQKKWFGIQGEPSPEETERITDAKHLPHDAWATTPVGRVMTRMPLRTLGPEADLSAALELMVANGVHQLPIVRDGALVGMLSRSDVMRYMQLGAELNLRGSAGSNEAPAESRGSPSRG